MEFIKTLGKLFLGLILVFCIPVLLVFVGLALEVSKWFILGAIILLLPLVLAFCVGYAIK